MRGMTPTADTIRELIKKAGRSHRDAANEIGVTQRTFRDWCAGKSDPPRAVMMALEPLAPLALKAERK